jgi:opacity protein-like surface antigen
MFRLCLGFSGVVFVVMLCCVPASAIAEEASTVQENPNNFIWSVSAQTGYQYMDLSFKAPFDTGSFGMELFHPSPLELELHNANLWVIGLGADVKKGRFSGFLEAKANVPEDTEVSSSSEPFWAGDSEVEWNDCKLKWWSINGGVGMDITPHITIQAGLKVERLSLKLNDPVDDEGLIPFYQETYGDSYDGKLKSKLLLPWIGVRAQISRLNGSLRFSPYAYTDLEIPLTYEYIALPTIKIIEEEEYSITNNGLWLEASLAYDIFKTDKWTCSLWGEASWLWTDGRTSNKYKAVLHQSGSSATTLLRDSGSEDGEYEIGTYGVGLRVNYAF